jgi:CBS domain-containing protein
MAQKIRELMTRDPLTLQSGSTVLDAARAMRDRDIGDVLVAEEGGKLVGILTDRDIVVRGLAEGKSPETTKLSELCTRTPAQLSPDDQVDSAIKLMEKQGIRRIPVVEGQKAIGIVSLGDLAVARDTDSTLASISAKSPSE